MIVILIIISITPKHASYDFVMLLMISISTTIFTSGKTLEYKLLQNKFIYYLEKLSFPIFVNHQMIFYVVKRISILNDVPLIGKTIIYLIITIIFSMIELFVINKLKKIKIKQLFIKKV